MHITTLDCHCNNRRSTSLDLDVVTYALNCLTPLENCSIERMMRWRNKGFGVIGKIRLDLQRCFISISLNPCSSVKSVANSCFSFFRLMHRWIRQIRALELFGEKNRLGRGSNLGQAGGNLCLWGPERFFSIVRNAQYTYPLFGRANI